MTCILAGCLSYATIRIKIILENQNIYDLPIITSLDSFYIRVATTIPRAAVPAK